ncbi:MAG: hypothetical protein ICV81_14110 [Flavisolibacter sp.]|nr:hypothetical protein [Flavisolibacter sp.]
MKKIVLLLLLAIPTFSAFAQQAVYLIPTLHTLHQTNQRYNYDSLRAIVARIKPDIIAIELRNEDLSEDSGYLKQHYPYEMWKMKYWFPDTELKGFDWFGNEISGKRIPDNYWRDQPVKRMEKLLSIDTTMKNKVANCQLYAQQRQSILQSGSLKDIYNSPDAILTRTYDDCLAGQLQNTDYAILAQYRYKRTKAMQQQVDCIIKQHPGKRIVVLVGDDYYPYILESLNKSGTTALQPQQKSNPNNNKKPI